MSAFVPCTSRPDYDRYSTSKSGGALMLGVGLLGDTVKEIIIISRQQGDGKNTMLENFLAVILFSTLLLECATIVISGILALTVYPGKSPPKDSTPSKQSDPDDKAEVNEDTEDPKEVVADRSDESMADPEAGEYRGNNKVGVETVDVSPDGQIIIALTPPRMRRMNDAVAIMSLILMILLAIKNAMLPFVTVPSTDSATQL